VVWLTIAALTGCASLPLGQNEREAADRIAMQAGFKARWAEAEGFRILTFGRGLGKGAPGGPVHVYLEGDGRAWRGRRPPPDPTPMRPMGLRLAALDPAPSILWIGRPCMYLGEPATTGCGPRWWTSHRYASPVVEAVNSLISRLAGGRELVLMGHSGGGALAVLVAARRDDVVALVTVSAPLDLGFWAENGRMTPLHGSLNPIDVAHQLDRLPQRHYAGGRDRVVPQEVIRRFVAAIPRPTRARLEIQAGYSHGCCWERDWPDLARVPWLKEHASY
jgi:hypothetical protein